MSKGKRKKEGKKVHKNIYEGKAGELGGKQKQKARGAYHPKGSNDTKTEQDYAQQEAFARQAKSPLYRDDSSSSSGFASTQGLSRRLEYERLSSRTSATALPAGVIDWGCWWKMGDYLFKRIERGGNKDKGFEPTEVPIIFAAVSAKPKWWAQDTRSHLLVPLTPPTYVSVYETTVEIPYTKRIVGGAEDYSYRRTLESSEILHFKE